jgi:hypothetical protein
MGIRFKCSVSDLNRALDIVTIVPPKQITPLGEQGYLFVVRPSPTGPRCYVYSRDATKVARADFPIEDVEGEGAFIYPSNIAGIRMLEGQLTFETDVDSEGTPTIRLRSSEGASAEKTGFDPRLLAPFDKEYEAATNEREIPAPILRVAIGQAKGYLLQPKDTKADEHFRSLQIFDASRPEWEKGNGTLFSADSTQMLYYWSEVFKDKGLAVHSQHIPSLVEFLGCTDNNVKLRTGANMTFATLDDGSIFGWAHHAKTHSKYGYYSKSSDNYLLKVSKERILKSLHYIKSELDGKSEKIKLVWSEADKSLSFHMNDGKSKVNSIPVLINEVEKSTGQDLTCFANVNHLINLFEGLSNNVPTFRIYRMDPSPTRPKGLVGFRTIDEFWLDKNGKPEICTADNPPEGAIQCAVTRFMPSME